MLKTSLSSTATAHFPPQWICQSYILQQKIKVSIQAIDMFKNQGAKEIVCDNALRDPKMYENNYNH